MTTAVAIQPSMSMPRPNPVPIAAARPRKQPKASPAKDTVVAGKPVSSSVGTVANIRTRRERPCDACRRRKSRCVIPEGAKLCVLCDFHKQECTFVQSPLPRKRKVVDDGKKDSPNNQKKRYVHSPDHTSLLYVLEVQLDIYLRILLSFSFRLRRCLLYTLSRPSLTIPSIPCDLFLSLVAPLSRVVGES